MTDTPDLLSRLRDPSPHWGHSLRSLIGQAAGAIEQLTRERDEFHEDNEVLRLRCERLQAEFTKARRVNAKLRLSAQTIPQSWIDDNTQMRAALERIAHGGVTDCMIAQDIAANALVAHEPATPGPAQTAEASSWNEASGGQELLSDEQIKHMVDRFLGWRLPEDFQPDEGISFNAEYNVEYNASRGLPPTRRHPQGTNLFDATQAEAMVRYMVEGMPSPKPVTGLTPQIRCSDTIIDAGRELICNLPRGHDGEHQSGLHVWPQAYDPLPGACPSPIGGKETEAECRAAGQCGCEEKS